MPTTDEGGPVTPSTEAAIRERYERATKMVADLCSGKERWTMRVPAEPLRDADLVISDALADIPVLLRLLAAGDGAAPAGSADVMPCAVLIDGALGSGVLISGAVYRVVESTEHWQPSGIEGEPPHVSTVVRFDPVPSAPAGGPAIDDRAGRDEVTAALDLEWLAAALNAVETGPEKHEPDCAHVKGLARAYTRAALDAPATDDQAGPG